MSSAGYEILPVLSVTAAAIGLLIFSICYAIKTKVSNCFMYWISTDTNMHQVKCVYYGVIVQKLAIKTV